MKFTVNNRKHWVFDIFFCHNFLVLKYNFRVLMAAYHIHVHGGYAISLCINKINNKLFQNPFLVACQFSKWYFPCTWDLKIIYVARMLHVFFKNNIVNVAPIVVK